MGELIAHEISARERGKRINGSRITLEMATMADMEQQTETTLPVHLGLVNLCALQI